MSDGNIGAPCNHHVFGPYGFWACLRCGKTGEYIRDSEDSTCRDCEGAHTEQLAPIPPKVKPEWELVLDSNIDLDIANAPFDDPFRVRANRGRPCLILKQHGVPVFTVHESEYIEFTAEGLAALEDAIEYLNAMPWEQRPRRRQRESGL